MAGDAVGIGVGGTVGLAVRLAVESRASIWRDIAVIVISCRSAAALQSSTDAGSERPIRTAVRVTFEEGHTFGSRSASWFKFACNPMLPLTMRTAPD